MKKIFLNSIIIVLLLGAGGCHNDFLTEEAFSDPSSSAFPRTAVDLDLVTNGIYARFSYYTLMYKATTYMVTLNSIEGCYKERGGGTERGGGDHYSWHKSINYSETFRRNFYWAWEVIRQCNDVLGCLENIEDVDQAIIDRAEGEAKSIRAWVYFDLIRLYGAMPIIDKSPELNDEDLFVSRPDDIRLNYDFIINDLLEAIEKLPSRSTYIENEEIGELGRMNKHAAMLLLSKVYITMNGYPLNDSSKLLEAKTLLNQIKTSGEFRLLDYYPDVFSMNNEQNEEILFAVSSNQYTETQRYSLTAVIPGNSEEMVKLAGSAQDWMGNVGVPNEFVHRYKQSDSGIRFQHNIVTEWKDVTTGKLVTAMEFGNAYIHKFYTPDDFVGIGARWASPMDFPLLRYSEVLLLSAEVENELDEPLYALEDINLVRERAGIDLYTASDFANKEQMRDSIFWERNLELCFENHGVYDLRRRGYEKLREIVTSPLWYDPAFTLKNNASFSYILDGIFDERHMLYPIPPEYINQNPRFKQNPGY